MSKLYKPPMNVAKEAKKGLELRKKFKRGGTSIGRGRARQLSKRKRISVGTIKRMYKFFVRHYKNRKTPPERGNGQIAWLLWGGDAGYKWSKSVLRREGWL